MKPIQFNEGGRHLTFYLSPWMVRIYLFNFSITIHNFWWKAPWDNIFVQGNKK